MLDKPQNELSELVYLLHYEVSEPTFLWQDFKGGAWCPARPIQEGVEEWLEVDLARQHIVTATETMGRYVGIRIFVLGIQYKITKLIFISNQAVDITGAESAGLVVDAARSLRRPTASSTGALGPGTPTRT